MLKAMARHDDGGAIIVLGLSHANVEALMKGLPIMFPGKAIGMEAEIHSVAIFVGPNESEMKAELEKRGMIGPETKYTEEPAGSEHVRRPRRP